MGTWQKGQGRHEKNEVMTGVLTVTGSGGVTRTVNVNRRKQVEHRNRERNRDELQNTTGDEYRKQIMTQNYLFHFLTSIFNKSSWVHVVMYEWSLQQMFQEPVCFQIVLYENHPRLSTSEDSVYQNLHPDTCDQNEIYCTIWYTQRTCCIILCVCYVSCSLRLTLVFIVRWMMWSAEPNRRQGP